MNNKCNLCGNESKVVWAEKEYSAFRCGKCGVIWVLPQPAPEKLKNIYSRDYFSKWYLKYEKERKAYFRERLKKVEEIMNAAGGRNVVPKVLDVGCGVGFFLEAAKEKGWNCEGLEMSEFASRHVRNKGFAVYTGGLAQADLLPAGYDLITAWDVFAHLTDPKGYLEKIRTLLRDNGLFVIKTPDHPYRLFRLAKCVSFTGYSRGILHIPAQIYHFEPKYLSKILDRFGFKVIKTERVKEAFKGGWTSSLWKNFLISMFNISANIMGIGESFIVYAIKK
jgi:SAM-dependent methyltransferase